MNQNYDENDIINEMLQLYEPLKKKESLLLIFNTLREVLYNLIHYNDIYNINEIIKNYGDYNNISILYFTKYKDTSIINFKIDFGENLNDYYLIAFIGMFDFIYNKIIEIIESSKFNNNEIDDLCNLMASQKI